ncbi:unnamed protein product [Rotaria sp. Silwood2]|nr:unnamed protein product [Rotaria sp. Silwood2]CAF3576277.1 unnamed protein product [Rotaria sp. Silwood2]CAF4837058.1 unnamed protein product [Rotaria sp. Silwood2]
MNSFIWDISRYNDTNGDIYLKNLDLCLSKLKQFNKRIIWIQLPPSESKSAEHINNLLLKLNQSIIDKINQYSINLLNLSDCFKSNTNIRHNDGIHFTPYGHRLITAQVADHMAHLQQPQPPSNINSTTSPSSNNKLVVTERTNFGPSTQGYKKFHQFKDRNRYKPFYRRNMRHYPNNQQIKFDSTADEKFANAFAIAYHKFKSIS